MTKQQNQLSPVTELVVSTAPLTPLLSTNITTPQSDDLPIHPPLTINSKVRVVENDDNLDQHPYSVASALSARALEEKKRVEAERGYPYNRIDFTKGVIERQGASYGPKMFEGSGGAIESIVHAHKSEGYVLTTGTCEDLAPGWIEEKHHSRPMWVLHCPDLPIAHIEGGAFFEGLASNRLNARNYTRENGSIGISFLVWPLAKRDEIIARVDVDLLDILRNADAGEGSIVVAYVGRESCMLTKTDIPVGIVDFLDEYEDLFERKRHPTDDSEQSSLMKAEQSIMEELETGWHRPAICRVSTYRAS